MQTREAGGLFCLSAHHKFDRTLSPLKLANVTTEGAGSFRMAVHAPRGPRQDTVSRVLLRDGRWEISSVDDIARMAANCSSAKAPRRGTFVDIGANIGYYSFLLAASGYDVLSVEPMGFNRRAFEATQCYNPELRERTRLVATALGRPGARGPCYIRSQNRLNQGNGVLRCADASADGEPAQPCQSAQTRSDQLACEEVPLQTLDEVLRAAQLSAATIVKIDTEGFECVVLEGAQSLFRQLRPSFILYEGQFPHVDACMTQQARAHGYLKSAPYHGFQKDTVLYLPEAVRGMRRGCHDAGGHKRDAKESLET